MKFKTFLVATAALTVGLSSCSKSETEGTEQEEGKPTVAKIVLDQSSMSRGFEGTNPTDAEKKINEARIYAFGPDRILAKIIPAVIDEPANSATAIAELKTGNHYFYATVNIPESKFAGITPGISTIGDFEDLILRAGGIAEMTRTTGDQPGFWMTNLGKSTPVKLKEATKENAADNLINIPVGRAVSKVGMAFNLRPDDEDQVDGYLDAASVSFRVRNNPEEMYSVPFLQGIVWKSPYFNNEQISGRYFDSTDQNNFIPAGGNTYATENSNAVPCEGNSTYLSIKGKFVPEKVYDRTGEEKQLGSDGTFWRIANLDQNGEVESYREEYYMEYPTGRIGLGQDAVEYTNGICYYALWLVDNTDSELYMVKRNTYYWVTIVSVDGAGANSEEKVILDPNKKLDEEAWIKATIQVLDWSYVSQSGGI